MFKFRRNQHSKHLSKILREADQARDERRCAEAAERYGAALALAPERIDIKVQRANMLKDSHQFSEAEAAYLEALSKAPLEADIYLQLGHLRKLTGRREQALADYRKALALDPLQATAHRELAAAGATPELVEAYEEKRNAGGLETLLLVRRRLDDLAEQIDALRHTLPEAMAAVAFPVEAYADLRRLYDVPPPHKAVKASLKAAHPISVTIILLADAARDLSDFHRQLSAVRNQAHSRWKLLVVGSAPDHHAIVKRAAAEDPRVSWVEAGRVPIGTRERAVARSADTDWVLFLGPGAYLHPQTLSWVSAISSRTECDAIFFDEEIGDSGSDITLKPVLRQTFDRDSLLEANIYGDTIAVSARVLAGLSDPPRLNSVHGARSSLLLALSEGSCVAHAPLPLVRRALDSDLPHDFIAKEHAEAVRAHLGRGVAERIQSRSDAPGILAGSAQPSFPPPIAVIIPTLDNLLDLKLFVHSLYDLATHPEAVKTLVLNNGSKEFRSQLDATIGELTTVEIVDIDEPFNWSRFNNLGVEMTSEPYLVFANDDMRMLTRGWDEIVRTLLERPEVGAVGARLLYPNDTLQHAGILFGWRGSVIHDGLHRSKDVAGPSLRWHVTRSASAVTGAFLATRRADFEAVGGFDAVHLAISYSDVDYALKLRSQGLRILWTPALTLYHFESKSRGLDHLHPAKAARDAEERRTLRARWPGVLDHEPSVNPMWHSAILPHQLLNFPSRERIWAYVEVNATRNPWVLGPPKEDGCERRTV